MPAITGKTIQQALSLLSASNLNLRIIKEKEDSAFIPGTILSQKPEAGRSIKSHQTIFVTTSKLPDTLPAPLLTGKILSMVQQDLKNHRMRSKIYYIDSDFPQNICIAQIPPENTPLTERKVILYLSKGEQKPIIFPDFRNKPLKEALNILKEYEIYPQITYADHKEYEPDENNNKIMYQRPLPGSLVTLKPNMIVQFQVASEKN